MDDDFVLDVFPRAWKKICEHIETTNENTGMGRTNPTSSALRKKSVSIDAAAFLIGINPRVFRTHFEDEHFVEKSVEKYYTDTRIANRTKAIVRFYWNLIGHEVDSSALSSIMLTSMKTEEGQLSSLERYIGSHVFIHLGRDDDLYEGPIDISKEENGKLVFVHRAIHTDHSSVQVSLDYQGIVVPYGNDMILLSLGANRAEPYFRIFSAQAVFNCHSQVTYGIYSGKTTADNIIFSARAALIPADIWTGAKRREEFVNQIKTSLGNSIADKSGALVIPRSLKTLFP